MDYVAKYKAIIIGSGEVGRSLFNVLKDYHDVYLRDIEPMPRSDIEVLNICFPYQKGFEVAVQEYQKEYDPLVTIIHSTVPIGTCRKLGAVHSPIHGKHPDLAGGIRTFVKYLGGVDEESTKVAEDFLREAKIKTLVVKDPETSEHSKLACTRYYGWNIIYMHKLKEECERLGTDFETVYGWNYWYNMGYEQLGMSQFKRPHLQYVKGKIGGHCVIPNCHLLDGELSDYVIQQNDKLD